MRLNLKGKKKEKKMSADGAQRLEMRTGNQDRAAGSEQERERAERSLQHLPLPPQPTTEVTTTAQGQRGR